MGPLDATKPWNSEAIVGMQRFLDKAWRIANGNLSEEASVDAIGEFVNRTIERVTQDVERLAMNTALAALIELTNAMAREPVVSRQHVRALILMLAPFAPHLAEELFFGLFPAESRQYRSVAFAPWPTYNREQSFDLEIQVPVTVNGRKKAVVTVAAQSSDEAVRAAVLDNVLVRKAIHGKTPDRVVVARSAKGALVNIVVKN
jgi:leucyl-tRNA synthetase